MSPENGDNGVQPRRASARGEYAKGRAPARCYACGNNHVSRKKIGITCALREPMEDTPWVQWPEEPRQRYGVGHSAIVILSAERGR